MVKENDGNLVVVKEEGKQYNCVGVGGGKTKYENQAKRQNFHITAGSSCDINFSNSLIIH